jgi:hypothetical protein
MASVIGIILVVIIAGFIMVAVAAGWGFISVAVYGMIIGILKAFRIVK